MKKKRATPIDPAACKQFYVVGMLKDAEIRDEVILGQGAEFDLLAPIIESISADYENLRIVEGTKFPTTYGDSHSYREFSLNRNKPGRSCTVQTSANAPYRNNRG